VWWGGDWLVGAVTPDHRFYLERPSIITLHESIFFYFVIPS
jgi:hypothetical protein